MNNNKERMLGVIKDVREKAPSMEIRRERNDMMHCVEVERTRRNTLMHGCWNEDIDPGRI